MDDNDKKIILDMVTQLMICSLRARKKAAMAFSMNADMQNEAELCQAQIDALSKY